MEKNKIFIVDIDFDAFEIQIKAKNKTEARKKALKKLSRKNPVNMIRRLYPSNRKDISVEEY